MNIRVFYQDFFINALNWDKGNLKLIPCEAVYIWNMDFEIKGNFSEADAEKIYGHMNELAIPPGHPDRSIFEGAKHTSMSIGDFIWVPDEKVIWMVASVGWRVWTREELIEQFGEQVFDLLNSNEVRYETNVPQPRAN